MDMNTIYWLYFIHKAYAYQIIKDECMLDVKDLEVIENKAFKQLKDLILKEKS